MINGRTADYPIDPAFLERWSPRAFTAEPISEDDLRTMLEAARWAASSSNAQPWRFLYARRDTFHWATFLNILVPSNQVWAKNASALVFFVSKSVTTSRDGKQTPSLTHSFDTGTASGFFSLQANRMGWFTHGMAGFDRDRAVTDLSIPEDYQVQAVFAVGRLADKSTLPEDLRAREVPSNRSPLTELATEGPFQQK